MSKEAGTGSDIVDTLLVTALLWIIAVGVFDIQVSIRLERVEPETKFAEAVKDTWNKSTTIYDHEDFVEPVDKLIPTDE